VRREGCAPVLRKSPWLLLKRREKFRDELSLPCHFFPFGFLIAIWLMAESRAVEKIHQKLPPNIVCLERKIES